MRALTTHPVPYVYEHPFAVIARRLNADMAADHERVRPGYTPPDGERINDGDERMPA